MKSTGFWLARDGKWRFELDDSKAKYKPSNEVISDYNKTGKSPAYLTDVLDYPEIYKAVPRLEDTLVVYDKSLDKKGEYNTETNIITLKAPHFKSILFHEIAHGINRSVGAFSGGSPGGVLVERTRKIIKDLKDVAKTKEVTDEIVSVEKDFNSGKIGVNEAGEKLITARAPR